MRLIVLFLLLVAADPAHSEKIAALDTLSPGGRNLYERCLTLVRRNAQEALQTATAWQNDGGGSPAQHCAALALVALKRYPEAARRLDQMGHEKLSTVEQRANLFDQAGNSWLLAHRGGEAIASFSSGLALSPRDPDLLADRARAAALLGDWRAAEIDLSAALKLDSNRADLLVLRASARHAFGRKDTARSDVDAALRIVPNYPEALLERGTLKFEAGDMTGAQADWQNTVKSGAGSPAAATAQQRLNALTRTKGK